MGSAVGQVPEYTEQITSWVMEAAEIPVLVKLTPNVTDVRFIGRAAKKAGADGLSLINTINSIVGVDLETLAPRPQVDGKGSHGGYCGPAVKPIALNMVQQVASDPDVRLPVSGIGGIQAWQDAVEFLLLGAGNVQVCTAAMHYGFRIVETLTSGLEGWMREKGFTKLDDFVGHSVPTVGDWADLDLSYKVVAEIDQGECIHCGLCYIACEDGAHQSIDWRQISEADYVGDCNVEGRGPSPEGARPQVSTSGGHQVVVGGSGGGDDGHVNIYEINQETCVGCNLCSLVCPVHGCISMVERESGLPSMSWREYQEKLANGEVEKIEPPSHV